MLCNVLTTGTPLPAARPPAGGPKTPYTGALGVSTLLYSDGSGTRVAARFGPGGDRPGQMLLRVVDFSRGVTRVTVQLRAVAGEWKLSGAWAVAAQKVDFVVPGMHWGCTGGHRYWGYACLVLDLSQLWSTGGCGRVWASWRCATT
jgi:hypothetical protein